MTAAPLELNAGLEVALDLGAELGEGPIWDDETGTLVFVDSIAGRIHWFDPLSGEVGGVDAGEPIGVAIPRCQDGFVVSGSRGLLSVDPAGAVALLLPIEERHETHRMNDAKCDSRGRLWSGTIPIGYERETCALYRVDEHLTLTLVQDKVSVSNGIAWSPDETILYYADTVSRGIDMFDYAIATGNATNRRRFVHIDRADGLPDGMTMDVEGHLWVAMYLGGAVRRYAPDGRLAAQITLPVSGVTSCAFGGPDLSDLFITTARHGVAEEKLAREPLAGALFRCRPGVAGLPTNRFAG